jgi:DNA (cytosine-5)-methyltransferase 1
MSNLTAVSLFAGIGGFDLALERNGINVVAAVEIDKKARQVLANHFPNTTLFNDVCEVTGDDLRRAGFIPERGIITGGFPCQDLSIAGRRAGLAGTRSSLFWEIARLIDELQPRYVIIENVPGLLSSKSGRDMGIVLGTLADLGYGYAWRVLDAQFFGVPQRRRRIFIVAGKHSGIPDNTRPVEILFELQSFTGNSATWNQTRRNAASDTDDRTNGDPDSITWFTKGRRAQSIEDFEKWNQGGVSPTLNVMDNSSEVYATVLQTETNRVRRLTPIECERLQGFPDNWTQGGSERTRYTQTGNAVAVPVIEWIIRRLLSLEQEEQTCD